MQYPGKSWLEWLWVPALFPCNFVTHDPLVIILVPLDSLVSHLQNGTKNVGNGDLWTRLGANTVGTYFQQGFSWVLHF